MDEKKGEERRIENIILMVYEKRGRVSGTLERAQKLSYTMRIIFPYEDIDTILLTIDNHNKL